MVCTSNEQPRSVCFGLNFLVLGWIVLLRSLHVQICANSYPNHSGYYCQKSGASLFVICVICKETLFHAMEFARNTCSSKLVAPSHLFSLCTFQPGLGPSDGIHPDGEHALLRIRTLWTHPQRPQVMPCRVARGAWSTSTCRSRGCGGTAPRA